MGLSLGDVTGEVYLRIDSSEDVPKLKRSGVHEILKASFDVITQAMAAGEMVSISHFGKFYPHLQPARNARNPRTGENFTVAEKVSPKFRPSAVLREAVLPSLKVVKEAQKKTEEKPVKKKKKKK